METRTFKFFLVGVFFITLTNAFNVTPVSAAEYCEASGSDLNQAKKNYSNACSLPRKDCDPFGSEWICASENVKATRSVKNTSQPNPQESNPATDSNSVGSCSAVGKDLNAAKNAYASSCSLPRKDCDPVNGLWVCSSENINQASLVTPSTPTTTPAESGNEQATSDPQEKAVEKEVQEKAVENEVQEKVVEKEVQEASASQTALSAATGLKASVYSPRSLELFWDRKSGSALSYEVQRDGQVVGTTNGVSFYDSGLSGDTIYTYSIVAINNASQRSSAQSISVNTFVDPFASGSSSNSSDGSSNAVDTNGPVTPSSKNSTDDSVNVLRVDLRTVTSSGPCNATDESGCKLSDVLRDTDKFDDHTVDINVHFSSGDFADDGTSRNAELRLRGGGSRFAPQKSFRIKLDSKQTLWRGERHLQLNKHPYETSRIRNKLAMDAFSKVPNISSPKTQFVNLWIDDGLGAVDYGLFTHVERVNSYFLANRGFNQDDRLYKAEYFRFNKEDLNNLKLDSSGEPINKDDFERTLEIENGDDHRNLVAMLNALHNPSRSFNSVLNEYFDKDNVTTWVAMNILLRQTDAVRHNYILHNPVGSKKFYFIPWDYDEAMSIWREPPNDFSNDSLRQRVVYGYAAASPNTFLNKFYRQPGIHQELLKSIGNIRKNYLPDSLLGSLAQQHIDSVAPYQQRRPDSKYNPEFTTFSANKYKSLGQENEEALRSRFGLLMSPLLDRPRVQGSQWRFSWSPAFDVTNEAGRIQYRLQIARNPSFESSSIYIDIGGISDDANNVVQFVDANDLSSGENFIRLIAIPANQPDRFWQISGNKLDYFGKIYYGAVRFVVR